jgi:anthranilate phosphoribosyltransferase
MTDLAQLLVARLADGETLGEEEAERLFGALMSGEVSAMQTAALLMALRVRGETVAEITGAARAMRAKALRVDAPADAVDTCGTGGDAKGTYNISTAAALIVAGAGVPVAKHGNRSVSSKSGSSQVLEALGVKVDAGADVAARAIREAGMGFLMAPVHHAAMKHVAPVRQELRIRTIFNLLGPLSNPAGTRRQVVGVFAAQWVEPLAHVLQRLGATHAWVVHGEDGLDELTTTGGSHVAEVKDGAIRTFTVTPADAGLDRAAPADLRGGDVAENAAALARLLDGEKGAYRDIAVFNAAAALIVAGRADTLAKGAALAAQSIDEGRARHVLEALRRITHEGAA